MYACQSPCGSRSCKPSLAPIGRARGAGCRRQWRREPEPCKAGNATEFDRNRRAGHCGWVEYAPEGEKGEKGEKGENCKKTWLFVSMIDYFVTLA